MGVRLLVLLLGLSMAWHYLQALQCHQCPQVNTRGICESEPSVCQTQGDQQCFVRKVYKGDKLLYGHQGCTSLCIPMSFFRPDARVKFQCCQDKSFCNTF